MFDFLCRDEQKPAQEEPSPRIIVVPPDVMKNKDFRDLILFGQLRSSRRFLIVAVLCELASAILSFHQPLTWKADIGPMHIENAQPGVLMAFLGIAIVWWTLFRVITKRSEDTPTPPPTPTPPTPAKEWLICRWVKGIFKRRASERSRHISTSPRAVEVPEDCTDDDFWKLAATCEAKYAEAGTIAGIVVMAIGVVEAIVGSFIASSWTVTFLWLTISDAPPAIVHMIAGFMIAVLTQFDVHVKRNEAKNKTDGGGAGGEKEGSGDAVSRDGK